MKKLFAVLSALVIFLAAAGLEVSAADTPIIKYDGGDALVYTDGSGNVLTGAAKFGSAFESMLPGVEYTQEFSLQNTSSSEAIRFYISLDVLQTLKADHLDGAGYTVALRAGETDIYKTENGNISGTAVGGSGSTGELADINADFKSADGKGILLATLAPGSTEKVSLSIKADETMTDAYQNATGQIEFVFFGEVVPADAVATVTETTTIREKDKIITKTVYVPGTVKTGVNSPVFYIAAIIAAAGLMLVLVNIKREKKDSKGGAVG